MSRKNRGPIDAQVPSLVGTWRLVSFVTSGGNRVVHDYWDDQPLGLLIYTPDGRVIAQLYDSRRPRLGAAWEHASAPAAQSAFAGMASYYGTYRIDSVGRTVTHLVEGAMSPDWIGSELVRAYQFVAPDRVELRVLTSADAGAVEEAVLVWDRITR